MSWQLVDDRDGRSLSEADEVAVKTRYFQLVRSGQMHSSDLYVEGPDGTQYDWNPSTREWEEL